MPQFVRLKTALLVIELPTRSAWKPAARRREGEKEPQGELGGERGGLLQRRLVLEARVDAFLGSLWPPGEGSCVLGYKKIIQSK